MSRVILTVAALLVAALPAFADVEEVMVDGVIHVHNPEEPRDGVIDLELEYLWERGDESDDLFFGVVPRVVFDEGSGEIFVLDTQLHEVQVFDAAGEWLRSIGREGEGPGEFRMPGDVYLAPDGQIGVLQIFPGRIVQLTKDGDPGTPLEPGKDQGFQVFYLAEGTVDGIVVSGAQYGGGGGAEGTQTEYLKTFNAAGEETAVFHTGTRPMRFSGMEFNEREYTSFASRWTVSPDGRVAVAPQFEFYTIEVHDSAGNLLHVIQRPNYSLAGRTAKEKARFQRMYDAFTSWNQGSSFKVSNEHQAVAQMRYRPDGSLWVLTGVNRWRGEEGVLAVWDVYNSDGVYVNEVRMIGPGNPSEDGFFFAGDRLYQVTNLFSATMSSMGGDEEDVELADVDPIRLVAWKIEKGIAAR